MLEVICESVAGRINLALPLGSASGMRCHRAGWLSGRNAVHCSGLSQCALQSLNAREPRYKRGRRILSGVMVGCLLARRMPWKAFEGAAEGSGAAVARSRAHRAHRTHHAAEADCPSGRAVGCTSWGAARRTEREQARRNPSLRRNTPRGSWARPLGGTQPRQGETPPLSGTHRGSRRVGTAARPCHLRSRDNKTQILMTYWSTKFACFVKGGCDRLRRKAGSLRGSFRRSSCSSK